MFNQNSQINDGSEPDIVLEADSDMEGPAETIKKLRERLKKCEADKQEYLAGWQRAKADFINARKEEQEAREDFKKYAKEGVVNEFLAVADGFDRAFSDPSWQNVDKGWQDGIKYLYSHFASILKDFGVEPIEARGKPFSPLEHEALEYITTEQEEEDGIVLEEARKGYKIHQKILRPAQVKVGKFIKN